MKKQISKIHPDLQQIARMTPPFNFNRQNLWLNRLLIKLIPAVKPPGDIMVGNDFIQSTENRNRIRLRIYKPKPSAQSIPVLLWMHGGGFIMGKPEMDDNRCMEIVHETGIAVVSVDYRTAPRHPFPAALEDCYAALKWVAVNEKDLGVDVKRIAVGGVSAGGGLAASLTQLALDRNEIQPIFQLLVYPMLDDRTVLNKAIDDRYNNTWTQKSNRFGWESYLGRASVGAAEVPAYSVPARREILIGLPPAWIGVGTLDVFHDEDLAYAQRLQAFGVACETQIIPGAFHGFDVINPQAPVVQAFRKSQNEALKKYLFP